MHPDGTTMSSRKNVRAFLSLAAGLWLIYESGYGIMQVLGVARSGHALFPLTGHFQNPGPFGGFVAMLMSVCLGHLFLAEEGGLQHFVKWICGVAVAMGFIVLPASMSRAGWFGLTVSFGVLAFRNNRILGWFQEKPLRVAAAVAFLFFLCVGGLFLKTDSALGRIHVWHMELLAMLKEPLKGFGKGCFAWAYGETQASYFASAERASWEIRVAGCPEYAFNEYLRTGVEWGIPGLLLFVCLALSICIILVRHSNPAGYGAIALSVFAFFSYPASQWQFRLWAGLFLAAALCELSGRYGWLSYCFFILTASAVWLGGEKGSPGADYRFLYQQGYDLFQEKSYEKALPVLREGASLSCDPMFHNIMGRCHEALGEYPEAEEEYIHAHYMVPCRLYPLVLLQELYLTRGDTLRADAVSDQIKRMPVNPRNSNMKRLQERALENR